MWLDRFSYYFSVKGRVGGIYSLTFEFLPDIADDRQNIDGIKQIIKADFALLESQLETLLFSDRRIRAEKTPVLTDSPHSLQAGYEYTGQGKKRVANLGGLLTNLFAILTRLSQKPGIIPKPIDPFTEIRATLRYSILKNSVEKKFAVINLEFTLGHDLNLSLFNSILNLPELHFSQQAQIEINHLQRALAMGENINPQQQLESFLI